MRKTGKIVNKTLHILLIFAILLSCFALTSCDREYDEGEVKEALEELLSKIGALNTVYFGRGISYISSPESDGIYSEANFLHLKELGFNTVEELKTLTQSVFTEKYSQSIFDSKLRDITDGENLIQAARYYQKKDFDGTNICILVDTTAKSIFDDRMTFDLSSICVEGSEGEQVICFVTAEVQNENGDTQLKQLRVVLIEEKDGWRIDNPVFANYSDN